MALDKARPSAGHGHADDANTCALPWRGHKGTGRDGADIVIPCHFPMKGRGATLCGTGLGCATRTQRASEFHLARLLPSSYLLPRENARTVALRHVGSIREEPNSGGYTVFQTGIGWNHRMKVLKFLYGRGAKWPGVVWKLKNIKTYDTMRAATTGE